jgi:hypothetical protein
MLVEHNKSHNAMISKKKREKILFHFLDEREEHMAQNRGGRFPDEKANN